jgi:predicted nucleotidyltransferase
MTETAGRPSVVDWDAGERRRRPLEVELGRIVAALPKLGVRRALLFGSLAEGGVGASSDLDLLLIVPSAEPFAARCARFYEALAPAVGTDLLVCTPEGFEVLRQRPFVRRALARARVVHAE